MNSLGLSEVSKQEIDTKLSLNLSWASTQYLASAHEDGSVRIWKMNSNSLDLKAETKAHENKANGVAWSPNSQELASVGDEKNVKIWTFQRSSLDLGHTLQRHSDIVLAVSWSSANILATGSKDTNTILWTKEGEKWQAVQTLQGDLQARIVIWSPDASRLAIGTGEMRKYTGPPPGVQIWQLQNGQVSLEGTMLTQSNEDVKALSWAPDSKQFIAVIGLFSFDAYHGRLGLQWEMRYSFSFRGETLVPKDITWSPDHRYMAVGLGCNRRRRCVAAKLEVQLRKVSPAFGSWTAQMLPIQEIKGPCQVKENQCTKRIATRVDLKLVTSVQDVAWGMLPCSKSFSFSGHHNYKMNHLTLFWEKMPVNWVGMIQSGAQLCFKIFSTFETLESLCLIELQVAGAFNCPEQLLAGAIKKVEIVGGTLGMPALSLHHFMEASPDFEELSLTKVAFPVLSVPPSAKMSKVVLHQTDLREIKEVWLGADALLDVRRNPQLELPYHIRESCESSEGTDPICLELISEDTQDPDKPVQLQAFMNTDDQWIRGARLQFDGSHLCQPGYVYQIDKSGKTGGCEPCPAATFAAGVSVSNSIDMVCLPCKVNQVTNGTAKSIDVP